MKSRKIDSLWSHLSWLGMLAATGSFTAAAQRLGVSKAAMSHRISELEQAAGVALVVRTTRSVRLTEAGQQLVDATRASFVDIERSFEGVRELAAAPSGLLRVTAPVALGRQRIVPVIPAFLRAHPQVRIELELSDRISSLAQEGFDLAVRHAASVPDTHVAWTLGETRSVLVATRAYLRHAGTPAAPADLAGHNCLDYLRGASDARSWSFEPVKGRASRISIAVTGNFSANNSEALREAALASAGIALLPDFSAERELASGKLVEVLARWRPVGAFGERIYAIRPFAQHVPRACQAFVSYLRATLNPAADALN
ncbi:LysR family transcriptional regulator [soil metagenome]